MNDVLSSESRVQTSERLPVWWRYALVAVATVVLCSCSGPMIQRADGAEPPTAMDSPQREQTTLKGEPIPMRSELDCPEGCGPTCHSTCASCMAGAGAGVDPYGPMVGPSDEYLCDGGDFGTPAGVRADWVVEGLDEEDAVGHYDTLDGRTVVTPSNRVCIYAPRFAAVRRVVNVIAHEQPVFINEMRDDLSPARADETLPVVATMQRKAPLINLGERPASLFRQRQQAGGLENLQATMDAYTSLAAYANLEVIRTGEVSAAERALLEESIESAISWTGIQAPQVVFGVKMAEGMIGVRQPGIIYQTDEPDRPRMRLIKLASCGHASPGEEVDFTLRFDNVGDQVIGNVTIVDNLSARLEYVADSAMSSVDADFITEPNDTGSLILRWEITEPVEPGEGGILRFRVKVR